MQFKNMGKNYLIQKRVLSRFLGDRVVVLHTNGGGGVHISSEI